MGQVLLTAARTQIAPYDLLKAQTAFDSATAAVKKRNAAVTAAGDDADKLSAAQAALKGDQALLDTAKLALTIAKNNQHKWLESATLTLLPVSPDPTARYVSDLKHSPWRDDTLKLSVTNSLLTTANVTSGDQTGNILISLADTAISIATLVGAAPRVPVRNAPPTCAYSEVFVFDPTNKKQVDAVNTRLGADGSRIAIADTALDDASQAPSGAGLDALASDISGVIYRLAVPVSVQAVENRDPLLPNGDDCALAAPISAQVLNAIVPDSRSRFFVAFKAGPFTTTTLAYGFSNGMLVDYTAQRPSEIAAAVGILPIIAKHIVEIPTSLIQARVNYDTQATALVNADTALKQAKIQQAASMAEALTAVTNAQSALLQAEVNGPAAVANARVALIKAQQALNAAQQSAAAQQVSPSP